mgnify:CR=1 FL=1
MGCGMPFLGRQWLSPCRSRSGTERPHFLRSLLTGARGTNVDEAALLDALNSGKVRAAGLDVYADEPASNAALYSHPMVSCTPHIGAATVEAQKRIGAEIVDIITNFKA